MERTQTMSAVLKHLQWVADVFTSLLSSQTLLWCRRQSGMRQDPSDRSMGHLDALWWCTKCFNRTEAFGLFIRRLKPRKGLCVFPVYPLENLPLWIPAEISFLNGNVCSILHLSHFSCPESTLCRVPAGFSQTCRRYPMRHAFGWYACVCIPSWPSGALTI